MTWINMPKKQKYSSYYHLYSQVGKINPQIMEAYVKELVYQLSK